MLVAHQQMNVVTVCTVHQITAAVGKQDSFHTHWMEGHVSLVSAASRSRDFSVLYLMQRCLVSHWCRMAATRGPLVRPMYRWLPGPLYTLLNLSLRSCLSPGQLGSLDLYQGVQPGKPSLRRLAASSQLPVNHAMLTPS